MKDPNDKSYEDLKRARHFSVGIYKIDFTEKVVIKLALKRV